MTPKSRSNLFIWTDRLGTIDKSEECCINHVRKTVRSEETGSSEPMRSTRAMESSHYCEMPCILVPQRQRTNSNLGSRFCCHDFVRRRYLNLTELMIAIMGVAYVRYLRPNPANRIHCTASAITVKRRKTTIRYSRGVFSLGQVGPTVVLLIPTSAIVVALSQVCSKHWSPGTPGMVCRGPRCPLSYSSYGF